jgi:ketopantoate reductase
MRFRAEPDGGSLLKILIVGTGAVGGRFGAQLARAGVECRVDANLEIERSRELLVALAKR